MICAEWKVKPTEFWNWSEIDKAYTIAYVTANSMIKSWEYQLQEEEAKRNARKGSMKSGKKGFRSRR